MYCVLPYVTPGCLGSFTCRLLREIILSYSLLCRFSGNKSMESKSKAYFISEKKLKSIVLMPQISDETHAR